MERSELEKAIKNLGGRQGHHAWTFEGVRSAVEEAKTSWETKKRVGGGKLQKTYHDVVCGLHAHSTFFACIPSSNTYVSVAAGAIQCLVSASKSHRDTAEQLTRALKEINDEVEACVSECRIIRSENTKYAVAKFYIKVFIFYGDAMKWYKSRSVAKLLNSFNPNFYESFKDKLENIKYLSSLVRRTASTGSMAELRDVRLQIDGMAEDFRAGLKGMERMNATMQKLYDEAKQKQVDSERKLRNLTERPVLDAQVEVLREYFWRAAGRQGMNLLLDSGRLQDLGIEQREKGPSELALSAAYAREDKMSKARISYAAGGQLSESIRDNANVMSLVRTLEDLISFLEIRGSINEDTSELHSFIDERIIVALDQWARAKTSLLLYVEGPFDVCVPSQSTSAAAKLVSASRQASIPLLSHFCNATPDSDGEFEVTKDSKPSITTREIASDPFTGLVLSLAYQLLKILPPLDPISIHLETSSLAELNNKAVAWQEALNLLCGVLKMAPAILLCVIDSLAVFLEDDRVRVRELLCVLRNAMHIPGKVFKVLFTSAVRASTLVRELDVKEMKLIEGSGGLPRQGSSARPGRMAFSVGL